MKYAFDSLKVINVQDSNTIQSTPGHLNAASVSNSIGIWKTFFGNGWTASWYKIAYIGRLDYEI